MDNNIKLLELGDKDKLRAALEEMKRNMAIYKEHVIIIAEIRKAYYDECIKQGFTSAQALELCKSVMS